MRKIIHTAHVACGAKQADEFYKNVKNHIDSMQSLGLEVEIQYAEGYTYSAFIIGREQDKEKT